jgi:hypothetical protein
MKLRLKGSLVILAIVLALALPGAYGANFVGNDNGGSYTAAVSAGTNGAVSLNSIGSANPHFFGTDAKKVKFSKKWTVGNTFSEVGFLLKNTQSYDVTVSGGKSNTLKQTNAELDLQATADYISAYGKSGTANLYKSGVDLSVNDGSADVKITTNADGIAKTTHAQLITNNDAGHNNAISGSDINTHAYFKGASTKNSMGDVWTYIEDGSVTGLNTYADSNLGSGYAGQHLTSASGDYMRFSADVERAVAGKNKKAETSAVIYDGYISGYGNEVTDNVGIGPNMGHQYFSEAGTAYLISIENIYTESGKGLKIQAEQDAYVNGAGTLTGYHCDINDPSVVQTVFDAYAGNPNNAGYVDFNGYYKQITGSNTAQMSSETKVTNGNLQDFRGEASDNVYYIAGVHSFGTRQSLDTAHGSTIYLDNKYTDNKKGYKETKVTATDPNLALGGTMTDVVGTASSDGTTPDTRVQGETSGLNTQVDAYKYYNQHQTASYLASNTWYNYFLGYVDDPVAVVGHLVGYSETIQHALDLAPNINGIDQNIFLRDHTYTGTGNKDIVNNIAAVGSNVAGEKSFTMWGAGSYIKNYGGWAANSVIDNEAAAGHRLFLLTSDVASQTFNFKNTDFNNGRGGIGGAIDIATPGATHASTVNIRDSNFNGNQAGWGGAIENWIGDTLNVDNCNFDSNTASGAADSAGGAIENTQGTVTVTNSHFTSNSANYGGAIAEDDIAGSATTPVGVINVNTCTFTNNAATADGGAIANYWTGNHGAATSPHGFTANVVSSTFTGNHAANGGAYYADGDTTTAMTGNTFTNNYAGTLPTPAGRGGAINIHQNGHTASYSNTGYTYSGNLPNDVQIDA